MFDTVFITGGSRGIGAAAVREFAAQGKRVAFMYLNSEKKAEALSRETGAFRVRCDVRSYDSVEQAVKEAKAQIGTIEVLINNAGISKSGLLTDMTPEEWSLVQSTNTDGAFYAAKAVLPDMISLQRGRIINVSSVWGVVGASCEAAYSASKAAVIGLTRAMAKEYASGGITVNAIAPGVINTDMNKVYTPAEMDEIIASIPLGRMAEPREVAQLMSFLASESAGYITGQVIGIDGGFGQ